jgi:uncharacterized membrane protein YqaE (UPF0057 family)
MRHDTRPTPTQTTSRPEYRGHVRGSESRLNITAADPIKVICAILLPPLGVFLEVGLKGHFWLNILLTLLGYIPGIIHALYVILRY